MMLTDFKSFQEDLRGISSNPGLGQRRSYPVIDHEHRAVRLASIGFTVEVPNRLERVRGFLSESEQVVVPRYISSVVFGHHNQPSPRIDHLMQRGPRFTENLRVEVFDKFGLCERVSYFVWRNFVLDDD